MLIVITNRSLCREDFLKRVDKIAQGRPDTVILREKDLSPMEYAKLFRQCEEICAYYDVPLVANTHIEAAETSHSKQIQLAFPRFTELQEEKLKQMKEVGVSIHSVQEVEAANGTYATRLIAGHIFPTLCKKDVPPRGLEFLRAVCAATVLPVYAIGGITAARAQSVLDCGCKGFCVMSELMTCDDPAQTVRNYQTITDKR